MRSKVAERILAKTPEHVGVFVRHYADLVVLVNHILQAKGIMSSADAPGPETQKWMRGECDFSLQSLAKLEVELGETLLAIPKPQQAEREFTLNDNTTL